MKLAKILSHVLLLYHSHNFWTVYGWVVVLVCIDSGCVWQVCVGDCVCACKCMESVCVCVCVWMCLCVWVCVCVCVCVC